MKRSAASAARARERRRLLHLHRYEFSARARGMLWIGGIDEVGRGPLAGPVVAACVVADEPLMIAGLNDSKVLAPERREALAHEIVASARAWAIGEANVREIERLNIYHASRLAMERALGALSVVPQYLIVDAMRLPSFSGEQLALVRGDANSASVAAASILAKVHRDRMLVELDRIHPEYGFAEHKGYATERHLAALREFGPCAHHRRGYAPVDAAYAGQTPMLFEAP